MPLRTSMQFFCSVQKRREEEKECTVGDLGVLCVRLKQVKQIHSVLFLEARLESTLPDQSANESEVAQYAVFGVDVCAD